jgi:CDP-2,3-bis-(O-geranylgeranyl)-sn-glycerol synthase
MTPSDPVACGVFLLVAFVLAGIAQTAWLHMPRSASLAIPLDGGHTWRGRRIFGANKTLRGFVVMVPAAAVAFAAIAAISGGESAGLWPLAVSGYAALGAWAAIGFMAGELPNSFVKRQFDIAPGSAPLGRLRTAVHFAIDRLDSGVGMLAAISLVVPAPLATWLVVLIVGPAIHWSFSVAMFHLGIKTRAA